MKKEKLVITSDEPMETVDIKNITVFKESIYKRLREKFEDWLFKKYPKFYSNVYISVIYLPFDELDKLKNIYASFKVWRNMIKSGKIPYTFNGDDWTYYVHAHLTETLKWMGKNTFKAEKTIPNIKRVIEIIENIYNGDYLERSGHVQEDYEWVEMILENRKVEVMQSLASEEVQEHNRQVFDKACKLEQDEWNELKCLLFGDDTISDSDCRNWWD